MILLLNGPPDSGKDTVADYISNYFGWQHSMFKGVLYEFCINTSGVSEHIALQHFKDRNLKEKESPLFRIGGDPVSPRKYLQHMSEEVIKPTWGPSFFGEQLANKIISDFAVVSDSGFIEEARALAEQKLVGLVQIHRTGRDFEGDTRRYLTREECVKNNIEYMGEIYNDSTLEDLYAQAAHYVNLCIDY